MAKAKEYLHIAAWHYLTGSMQYYVENLQAEAEQNNAPIDACYRRMDGSWLCANEIDNKAFLQEIETWITKRSGG